MKLEKQLEVSGDEAQAFNNNLKYLKEALPKSGVLLPYSVNTSFQLLEAACLQHLTRQEKP